MSEHRLLCRSSLSARGIVHAITLRSAIRTADLGVAATGGPATLRDRRAGINSGRANVIEGG
jgi:hypothetical protein